MKLGGAQGAFLAVGQGFTFHGPSGGQGFTFHGPSGGQGFTYGGAKVSHFTRLRGAKVSHFARLRGSQARVSHFTRLRAPGFHISRAFGGPGFHISRAFGGPGFHISRAFGGPGFHISRAFISRAFGGPGFHVSRALGGGQGFTFHAPSVSHFTGLRCPEFRISPVCEGTEIRDTRVSHVTFHGPAERQGFTFHESSGRQGFTFHGSLRVPRFHISRTFGGVSVSHFMGLSRVSNWGAPGFHNCWVSEGGVTGVTVSRSRRHRNHANQGGHGVTLVSLQIVEKALSPKGRTTFFGRHDPQTSSCRGLTAGRSVTFR